MKGTRTNRFVTSAIYGMWLLMFLNWCSRPTIVALAAWALFIWHEAAHLEEPVLVSAADAGTFTPLFVVTVLMGQVLHFIFVPPPKWPRPRTEGGEPR